MLITLVAGARPNFMKIAPIIHAIKKAQNSGIAIMYRLVHTGQHYDKKMSSDFFEQLNIPEPDINLECGGGTQAEQTAAIMVKFEKELLNNRPNLVIVVGDVTSTMACTITAKKLCIDVAHVEAGIRSGDMTMPEEINRIVTDSICDHFYTTSNYANELLRKQQVPESKIHFVGNTMIDTLYHNLHKTIQPDFWNQYQLSNKNYFLITLHRPSNVDNPEKLNSLLKEIMLATTDYPVIFPVHPRTKHIIDQLDIQYERLIMIDPQPYLQFIYLVQHSKGIITDSGGITEEATVLQIPCITLRNSTERPETITMGTNELIGDDMEKMHQCLQLILQNKWKSGTVPPLWDGKTAERIVENIAKNYLQKKVAITETF
jgi:UDP-N-acetylglucosamine 2-epimerase (non-hydrolysing)